MEALNSFGALDAVRLSDWIDATGLSRSTAYELLRLLQIEPEARRVPTSRKPVSHLTGDQMDKLAPWVAEIKRGATLPQIRDRLGRNDIIQEQRLGQNDIIQDNSGKQSGIIPAEQITAALAAIVSHQQQAQPVDPLRCARALADAAALGVALSSVELAGVVGMSPATVSSWADGHSPRPGFTLRRHKAGAAVWWLVERPGRNDIVQGDLRATGGVVAVRSVGFAQVLDVQAVTLPNWHT